MFKMYWEKTPEDCKEIIIFKTSGTTVWKTRAWKKKQVWMLSERYVERGSQDNKDEHEQVSASGLFGGHLNIF